jgi:hypothetical protein
MHPDAKLQFSKAAERYHGHCTTAPEQVDTLWKGKFSECNVAIKCAPGHAIVDADKRNGGIESAIAFGLLDSGGIATDGAYGEKTRDDGWRFVYTLPDGLGRGLKAGLLAPGLELTFEDSQSLVLVAPSVVDGRPYVALSDTLAFTPAPDCIVALARRLQAERAPRPRTIQPDTPTHTPLTTKARYAAATLFNVCDELRGTLKGSRFNTLRRVSLVVGSVCAACGTNVAEAARQLEAATADWTNTAKVHATIASGLAKGATAPASIDWQHGTGDTFGQAAALVLQWLQASKWNGVQAARRENVSTASVQTVATAMADYSLSRHLYGVFVVSQRTLRQMTGCGLRVIKNAIDALCKSGLVVIVGRDEHAFIHANGTDAAKGDKRLQARAYAFDLAEIGRHMAKMSDWTDTVIVHRSKGKACASYDLYSNAHVTVSVQSTDSFSKLALGRPAGAVLSKLLATPNGLNDGTLAALTGLHIRTVKRAIGRLLLHGLVGCDGDTSRAVDSGAIQAALVAVADTYELDKRRETRDTVIRAERTAHSAYVLSRRAGTGETDAQRLSRHVYNVIRHPNGQKDAIDADGVITPANVTTAPSAGDYANTWEQHVAAAQAERDAAHKPTPNVDKVLAASALAHLHRVIHSERYPQARPFFDLARMDEFLQLSAETADYLHTQDVATNYDWHRLHADRLQADARKRNTPVDTQRLYGAPELLALYRTWTAADLANGDTKSAAYYGGAVNYYQKAASVTNDGHKE